MDVQGILDTKGPHIITIEPHEPISKAVQLLERERIGALVVSDDGKRLLGIVSERDVVLGLVKHGGSLLQHKVSEIFTEDVVTCAPEDSVGRLMKDMTHRRVRHLPVLENGEVCGMISVGDVIKYRLDEVELETGVLRDEYIVKHSLPE